MEVTILVFCGSISAHGGGMSKFHFFYHFLTDWFNAVSILLSVQYHQSIQYNVREEGI